MTSRQLKLMEKPIKKQEWLEMFLRLPKGIPFHSAFARIFRMLEAEELEKSFLSWLSSDLYATGIQTQLKVRWRWLCIGSQRKLGIGLNKRLLRTGKELNTIIMRRQKRHYRPETAEVWTLTVNQLPDLPRQDSVAWFNNCCGLFLYLFNLSSG